MTAALNIYSDLIDQQDEDTVKALATAPLAVESPEPAATEPAQIAEDADRPAEAATTAPDPAPDPAPFADGREDLWINPANDERPYLSSLPLPTSSQAAAAPDVSADQILHDRPDVLAAFHSEYWGPHNDRHSSAWDDRVGGHTPQDYALYWYAKMGGSESYQPADSAAAPALDEGEAPVGRTTYDGVSLNQILTDRPDVFQAFFTEYYGPNNDRHSSAWDDRVGGHTPQDYANYWYETSGKLGGYVPSTAHAAAPDLTSSDLPAPADPTPDDPSLLQVGQTMTDGDPLTGI